MTGDQRGIPAARARELLEQGHARALLPECFPVPVEIDGAWWHVPAAGEGDDFVLAEGNLAAEFSGLAARRSAADAAVEVVDRSPSP